MSKEEVFGSFKKSDPKVEDSIESADARGRVEKNSVYTAGFDSRLQVMTD